LDQNFFTAAVLTHWIIVSVPMFRLSFNDCFICYESLIILLFFLLFLFTFFYYRIRSAFFLFLFSIFGSISFIISLLIVILSQLLISYLFILFPFFIKIPSFPFFYWLPEIHCEVNSSISLFLAGLLLKLGVFGCLRIILSSFFLALRFLSSFVLSFSLMGVLIVSCSCFRFFDLKKIIAFSSILHLNLTLVSIYWLNSISCLCGIITSISHGFCSVGLFLFSGFLINKTYSRYLDCFFFIDCMFRGVLLLFLLCNLSFPGSFNFVGEILALISIVEIDLIFCLTFLVSGFLSCFYWFLILNRKFGYSSSFKSLNAIELFIILSILNFNLLIGLLFIFLLSSFMLFCFNWFYD